MAFSNKEQSLSKPDLENEATDFPRFIVLESLEETYLTKLSPFFMEKVISRRTPRTVQKTRNSSLLVEVDNQRHAKNVLKIKNFQMTKFKVYPHEKLNTLQGVIKSRELSLATAEEITAALGKQGITEYKRIIIRKGREEI